jgi:hypothetical protein
VFSDAFFRASAEQRLSVRNRATRYLGNLEVGEAGRNGEADPTSPLPIRAPPVGQCQRLPMANPDDLQSGDRPATILPVSGADDMNQW